MYRTVVHFQEKHPALGGRQLPELLERLVARGPPDDRGEALRGVLLRRREVASGAFLERVPRAAAAAVVEREVVRDLEQETADLPHAAGAGAQDLAV
ncbi:MAG: hypothetical protein ACYTKD_18245 [Planctomycetota bacterium]